MQLCNWNIEPEEIDTSKNHLICFRVAFWKKDTPIFEVEPSTEEPQRYHFEYEKQLEPKLIEAIKQSEILTVIAENRKIIQIK